MARTTYYTGTTLDGFIATTDHDLGWLVSRHTEPDGPMGYDAFIAGVGAVAMGSTTYQWILDHEDARWPYEQPAWVFSSREMPRVDGDVRHVHGDVAEHHADMVKAADGKDVWVVGGGGLAGQFAAAGLLDEVVVSVAPVTLGAGAPLLPGHVELRLVEVARNGDFACLRYDVVRDPAT